MKRSKKKKPELVDILSKLDVFERHMHEFRCGTLTRIDEIVQELGTRISHYQEQHINLLRRAHDTRIATLRRIRDEMSNFYDVILRGQQTFHLTYPHSQPPTHGGADSTDVQWYWIREGRKK